MSSFVEYFNDLDLNPNNMSKWLPVIQDCGLRIPKTAIIPVPPEIGELFFMEKKGMSQLEIIDAIYKWTTNEFIPKATAIIGNGPLWFIKNGTFSNKFNFSSCKCMPGNPMKMNDSIIDINYTALLYGADGITEMVAREFIPPAEDVPCIYNGMPMRTEVRVFYDFTRHHVVYAVNYWDEGYCRETISRNPTDKIVYNVYYPVIAENYEKIKLSVMTIIETVMKDISGLEGVWSIDVMDNRPLDKPFDVTNLWLTDMAMGYCSAYWDKKKVEQYEENLLNGKETVWVL